MDYRKNGFVSEVKTILGEIPWEYEKKLYNLSPEKRKYLLERVNGVKSLKDLDNYL